MLFWTSALASTIPTPSGIFIPVLKMGAAYGRLIGELMHMAFPDGIKYAQYGHLATIVPGSYAVVGAAAFSGAVTHTISTSVILFEMTGQIVHIIPVILGVLIANAVCQSLQPSIYDSIIEIKKLPYLPPIASSNSVSHKILVKDFMNMNLAYVWKEKCTYADVKSLLSTHKKLVSFPLVESPNSMKLLGSVARPDLLKLLYLHLGRERRLQEIFRKNSDVVMPGNVLATVSGRLPSSEGLIRHSPTTSDSSKRVRKQPILAASPRADPEASTKILVSEPQEEEETASGSRVRLVVDRAKSYGSTPPTDAAGYSVSPKLSKSISPSEEQTSQPKSVIRAGLESCERNESGGSQDLGVAKLVNLYDRGSAFDEVKIGEFEREIKTQIARSDVPDKVVVEMSEEHPSLQGVLGPTTDSIPAKGKEQYFDTSTFTRVYKPLSPLADHKSLRPTKSILKTSSSASFGGIYKRNISSQSFSSTLAAMEHNKQRSLSGGAGAGNNQDSINDILNVRSLDEADLTSRQRRANFTLGDGTSSVELTPVRQRRKVRLPRLRVIDMTPEEQAKWERDQLNAYIDISSCQIDEAPFQLVEQTSLYRVHTLFSMLGLNHAYVTSFGRLVGIVALKDIRHAIERMLLEK